MAANYKKIPALRHQDKAEIKICKMMVSKMLVCTSIRLPEGTLSKQALYDQDFKTNPETTRKTKNNLALSILKTYASKNFNNKIMHNFQA